jgi:RNA recognition motif-containing protein
MANTDTAAAAAPAAADGTAGITEAMQATSIEEQGHKVFIGNLSFATKEEELKTLFGEHGKITDAQIILRGTRSLGYGFVTFANKDEAAAAVGKLDKTELGGRVVNVEIAKPPPGAPGGAVPRATAKAAKKAAAAAAAAAAANGDAAAAPAAGENEGDAAPAATKKRNRKPRKRGPRGNGDAAAAGESVEKLPEEGTTATPAAAPVNGEAAPAAGTKKSRRGTKGKKQANGEKSDGEGKKRGPPEGEPSKTLLFVANLPFGLDDEGLKNLFDGYKVASAHVVKRRFGPAEGRSKGFGFVDLESEEEQKRALEGIQGKEVEGRAVQVKVAVSEAKEKVEKDQEAAAPVEATPAAPAAAA